MPETDISDADAVRAVMAGDVDTYGILVARHRDRVAAIVAGHVPVGEAAETAHEVFVRAYKALPGYAGRAPFGHWLAGIAVRVCHDYWRARYRRRETPLSDLGEDGDEWIERAAKDEDAVRRGGAEQLAHAREWLDAAMARLSPADRLVLTLAHLEERPMKEVDRKSVV